MHPLRQNPARLVAVASGITVSTVAALTAALVVAAPATAGAATTTTTTAAGSAAASGATAQYNAALKAIGTKGVHFASVAKQNGAELDVSGDAGTTSGAQTLVVKQNKLTERMSAKVVGSTGYVSGNSAALQHVIGLTKADATKYAGKWLSFPTSNQGLGELVGGLLSSQVSKELEIGGPYTYGKTATVAGQHATAIKGAVATESGGKVPVVLYIPAKGTPLPIQEVTNAGTGGGASAIHGTVTFTHWGENKSQTAPAKSTSLLKLVPASSGSTTGG
ncbi:MAG TPA: hypothetical protein VH012_00680 [Acidimicrobiales bacterium]|jgi:hypothetical protein|nr:hypothetical protein [Acidimicrobiales bacterium]